MTGRSEGFKSGERTGRLASALEIERLRKALELIAYAKFGSGPALRECIVIARAALDDTK